MTTGTGEDYTAYQDACLEARSAMVVVENDGAFAKTKLKITDRYAGDNYQVRATLQKPHNLEPFDTWTDSTTVHTNTVSTVAQSATMIAWKRVLIELDKMYTKGATITADASYGATTLKVDSVQDFNLGDDVVVFWKGGSHNAKITGLHSPNIFFLAGSYDNNGVTHAEAVAEVLNGEIYAVRLIQPGSGYTNAPSIKFATRPGPYHGSGAAATAIMAATGISILTITAGEGYTVAPLLGIGPPDVNGGTQALADATVNANGEVIVTITNPGTGYRKPPALTWVGGDGAGFRADTWLQPTHIERVDVLKGGIGHNYIITFENHPLIENVFKYGGVRPKTQSGLETSTCEVSLRYLTQAFGDNPDGSDGGAFIEFKNAPENLNNKTPKYESFPSSTEWIGYSNYWFDNKGYRDVNYLHHLAANRIHSKHDKPKIGGLSSPVDDNLDRASLSVVFTGNTPTIDFRDDVVVHEIGHRFGLVYKHSSNFDHIDNNK